MFDIKQSFMGLGYNKKEVEEVFEQMTEEIVNLKNELYKTSSANNEEEIILKQEIAKLSIELKEYQSLVQQKDNELVRKNTELLEMGTKIQNTVPAEPFAKSNIADSDELAYYKSLLTSKEREIAQLTSTIAELRAEGAVVSGLPNFDKINKLYERAYESANLYSNETKDDLVDLTTRICDELSVNIFNVSSMYSNITKSKITISALIDQAVNHFKSVEDILNSFTDDNVKIDETKLSLIAAKANILSEINKNFSHTENAVVPEFEFRDDAPAQKNNSDFEQIKSDVQPQTIHRESTIPVEQLAQPDLQQSQSASSAPFVQQPAQPIPSAQIEQSIQITPGVDDSEPFIMPENTDDTVFTLEALMVNNNTAFDDKNSKKFVGEDQSTFNYNEKQYNVQQHLQEMKQTIEQAPPKVETPPEVNVPIPSEETIDAVLDNVIDINTVKTQSLSADQDSANQDASSDDISEIKDMKQAGNTLPPKVSLKDILNKYSSKT